MNGARHLDANGHSHHFNALRPAVVRIHFGKALSQTGCGPATLASNCEIIRRAATLKELQQAVNHRGHKGHRVRNEVGAKRNSLEFGLRSLLNAFLCALCVLCVEILLVFAQARRDVPDAPPSPPALDVTPITRMNGCHKSIY